jgi:hypothetical protein
MTFEMRLGCVAFGAIEYQRGEYPDVCSEDTHGTHQPSAPQSPLQAKGLASMWLKKQVSAYDRSVYILPHKEQGNFDFWGAGIVGTTAGSFVVGTVVDDDCNGKVSNEVDDVVRLKAGAGIWGSNAELLLLYEEG